MIPMELPAHPLERLLAALLSTDRAALVHDVGPAGAELTLSDRSHLVVFFASTAEELEERLQHVLAHVKPGMSLRYLAAETVPGAREVFERLVPARWKQVRSAHAAHLWSQAHGVTTVVGQRAPLLNAAHAWLEANTPPPLASLLVERAEQVATHDDFFQVVMRRRAWATQTIAAASVLFFALEWWWGDGNTTLASVRMGAASGALLAEGQVWRLLAPMLLHGSVFHLAMNMLALFGFGTFLERFLGWRRYLALYVLSGLGGSIASSLRETDVISVGASGGIWGLMLAGAMLVTVPRGKLPALVVAQQRGRAWTPVIINALYSFRPGIDFLAHLGGGLVGALLVASGLMLLGIPRAEDVGAEDRPPVREGVLVKAVSLSLAASLVLAMVAALVTGRPWELRDTPSLTRTPIAALGVSLELPDLMGAKRQVDANVWVAGQLGLDPLAVIVSLDPARLDDEQAADPRGTLELSVDSLATQPHDGFRVVTKNHVVNTPAGRPLLVSESRAEDGRRELSAWFIEGHRVGRVVVVLHPSASAGWAGVGERLAESLAVE